MNFKYVLSIIIVFAFSGCKSIVSTSTSYEYLTPAYYTLPDNIDSVLVASCVTEPPMPDTSSVYLTLTTLLTDSSSYTNNSVAALPSQICNVVANKVNESKYLSMKIENRIWHLRQLRTKSDSICKANGVDAILALLRTDLIASSELDDNEITFSSILTTKFSVVYPDGNIDFLETQTDTLQLLVKPENGESIQIPINYQRYYPVAEFTGLNFANKLIPMWDTGFRKIIELVSSTASSEGVRLAYDGKWDQAKNLWLQIYDGKTDLERFCAAFNLGVYYDMIDRPFEASHWYSAALDIIEKHKDREKYVSYERLAEQYFGEAIKRMKDLEILDQQMNGNE